MIGREVRNGFSLTAAGLGAEPPVHEHPADTHPRRWTESGEIGKIGNLLIWVSPVCRVEVSAYHWA
jgi:hypothetical protein